MNSNIRVEVVEMVAGFLEVDVSAVTDSTAIDPDLFMMQIESQFEIGLLACDYVFGEITDVGGLVEFVRGKVIGGE